MISLRLRLSMLNTSSKVITNIYEFSIEKAHIHLFTGYVIPLRIEPMTGRHMNNEHMINAILYGIYLFFFTIKRTNTEISMIGAYPKCVHAVFEVEEINPEKTFA